MARKTIEDERIDRFGAARYGPLIRSGDPKYVDARAVENGVLDEYPARIARCAGVADVRSRCSAGRNEEECNE